MNPTCICDLCKHSKTINEENEPEISVCFDYNRSKCYDKTTGEHKLFEIKENS